MIFSGLKLNLAKNKSITKINQKISCLVIKKYAFKKFTSQKK